MDLTTLTDIQLLQCQSAVIDELLARGVVRTRNNPLGDYTEWLVCRRLGLTIQSNSKASYDAVDSAGTRYQIKGRRTVDNKEPIQLSVIRNLDCGGFDYLISVIFDSNFGIRFAAKIPHYKVQEISTYRKHVNGHVPMIRESVFNCAEIENITEQLHHIDLED